MEKEGEVEGEGGGEEWLFINNQEAGLVGQHIVQAFIQAFIQPFNIALFVVHSA